MNKIKILYAISAFIITFLISGCFDTPKEPVSPSWNIDINMPITDTSYTLVEIIKPENNPNLHIIDDASYDSIYFLIADEIEKIVRVQDDIKMPVRIAPEQLKIAGPNGGSTSLVYNPDPNYRLDTALFKSGFLVLTLNNNNYNESVNYQLRVPGFRRKDNGSRLSIDGVLSPGESRTTNIDIKDYNYAQLKKGGINTDSTQRANGFLIIMTAKAGNVDFVTQVRNDEITLTKLVGKLKRTELAYATNEFEQSFGKEAKDVRSKIKFKSTKVELRSSTFGAMKNLKIIMDSMTITGYTKLPNGTLTNPVKLLFNGKPYFSDTLVAGEQFVHIFDETNSSVADFLSQMPDVIKMGSKNVLDNITTTSTISNEDYIKFDLKISAPAHFALADAGYRDTVEVELTQDEKDDIARGNSANLFVEITNKIPLGIKAKATFLDDNYQPLFSIRNTTNTMNNEVLDITPCAVDNNGRPTTASATKIGLTLDKNDFQKFKFAKYIVFDVYIRSTGSTDAISNTYVQVRAKDSVRFKVYGGVNYNIDPEDM